MSPSPDPATWSGIAAWYDALLQSGSGPHQLAVETTVRLSAARPGADVLDIACGQGIASRALARAGARSVTGADLAPEMIEAARRHEAAEPLGIVYLVEDATTLRALPDTAFDLVTCQLGLMDIPDLPATLTAVHRVLRPGGSFVFVIGHPAFLAPDARTLTTADGRPGRLITDYLDERFWRSPNPYGVRRAGNTTGRSPPTSTRCRPAASPSNASRSPRRQACWPNSSRCTRQSRSSSPPGSARARRRHRRRRAH